MLYRNSLTSPVLGLRREIDRLFEDTFSGRGGNLSGWMPAVDISENQNEVRLDVEIPGMRPDDIEVTAENGVLTIRGEKQGERKEDEENRYHLIERTYGSFARSFQLPQGLDESRIEASFDNGILSVHIPKSALPQPRRIQISGGSGQQRVSGGNSGKEQGAGQNRQAQAGNGNQGAKAADDGGSRGNRTRSTAGSTAG